ncbi:MAG: hypothetical protein NTY59_07950 [Alphaproteobacteria bacterium]|nr:hypothetical protein [Alphaproteobacteria bacterium]
MFKNMAVLIAFGAALALAACDEDSNGQAASQAPAPPLQTAAAQPQTTADEIMLPERAKTGEDWSKSLPEIYRAVSDCLAADAAPPAYALSVAPENRNMVLVAMVGKDGARSDCRISTLGGKPDSIAPMAERQINGPRFFPASFGEAPSHCTESAQVTTKAGALLGWLVWAKPDCA